MATWEDLSLECLRAAKILLDSGYLRRSISSAYYAAYSAIALELVARGVTFARGWRNPAHEQLPDLILRNTTLPRGTRRHVSRLIRRLRAAREAADYRPHASINRELAVGCVRDAIRVLTALGVERDGTE